MFVPVILGSDKTVASVGTRNTQFWPIYGLIGNVHNSIRRAHGRGLVLIGFLAIPKGLSLVQLGGCRVHSFLCLGRQSWEYELSWISPISSEAFSFLFVIHSRVTPLWRDHSGGLSVSWWLLSSSHMGDWPISWRLSRTSTTELYCTRLVCPVRVDSLCCYFFNMIHYSCQGHKEDLDGMLSELQRTRYLTESLVAKYRAGTLWDKFGIVSDIVVSIY